MQVVQKVECCYSKPQVMSLLCHSIIDLFLLFCSFLFFFLVVFVYIYMFTSCLCAMECIFWNKDILSYLIYLCNASTHFILNERLERDLQISLCKLIYPGLVITQSFLHLIFRIWSSTHKSFHWHLSASSVLMSQWCCWGRCARAGLKEEWMRPYICYSKIVKPGISWNH